MGGARSGGCGKNVVGLVRRERAEKGGVGVEGVSSGEGTNAKLVFETMLEILSSSRFRIVVLKSLY